MRLIHQIINNNFTDEVFSEKHLYGNRNASKNTLFDMILNPNATNFVQCGYQAPSGTHCSVIYVNNDYISFQTLPYIRTELISFAFSGCYMALATYQGINYEFHIPPKKIADSTWNKLKSLQGFDVLCEFSPIKDFFGPNAHIGPGPAEGHKYWGLIDYAFRMRYAIRIYENLVKHTMSYTNYGHYISTRIV